MERGDLLCLRGEECRRALEGRGRLEAEGAPQMEVEVEGTG
jgi:hypothetical protein